MSAIAELLVKFSTALGLCILTVYKVLASAYHVSEVFNFCLSIMSMKIRVTPTFFNTIYVIFLSQRPGLFASILSFQKHLYKLHLLSSMFVTTGRTSVASLR